MQQHVTPFKVFLFLFALFGVLITISLVFPTGGIRLGEDFYLYFPGRKDVLKTVNPKYADISHLLDAYESENNSLTIHYPEIFSLPVTQEADSYEPADKKEYVLTDEADTVVADAVRLRELVFPLQLPPDNDSAMDMFYEELDAIKSENRTLRIIHYGDSQIENNRITSALRNRFQSAFGGSGIGMFPVVSPVPHNASVNVILQGRWKRYTPLGGQGNTGHNRYGLLLSFSSLVNGNIDGLSGSFTLRPTGTGYRRLQQTNELGIFFGYNNEPFTMELISGDEILDAELFFPADSLQYLKWKLPRSPGEYSVSFQGEGSPLIFSVSLDDASGVSVDNVPLRGSSGLEFAGTDPEIMRKMMENLNVRLLLLQFGVNVVPHVVDDYTYYENALLRQLDFFRSLDPDIVIIVIGVSDMSRKITGGYYESFPNIELIRDAQRNAAFRAGFAFWDMYEAMGGKNSMPAWVTADPPLAQADHIHFTFRGSALLGDLLYNSIISGYDNYGREQDNAGGM